MHGKNISPLHPILLARLTGKLGDKKTIEKISSNLGYAYTQFLPKIFKENMDVDIDISYVNCHSGKFSHAINSFKENFVFHLASLRGWSCNFFMGCSNNLVITLLEYLLEAPPEKTQKPHNRPLSTVEKKLAKRIIDQISTVIHQCISTSQDRVTHINEFYDIDFLKKSTTKLSNEFVTTINMTMNIADIICSFALIIPQEALIKTVLIPSSHDKLKNKTEDLNDSSINQRYQLKVNIDTRIDLQKIKLKDILELKIGQVIPFLNKDKKCAILSANGKEIYSCELGRIGKNYTVRVKDRINFDQEIFENFLHKK
ncbi:FliM/FliN family flagellar motor switch protein [Candidatus Liberibacter africanus]|uniref:Flagellar motor switch protein FliM n=1 Tax=Candidatus Liberibacter africanus PTSAPSY TaxID=1277257 RepID=A0A0G3I8E0_LIBAF|nr:FliM/FliN family flagellar motor switch protein [Candidatus Liberibacter africanus]AKK19987.1 surface presentation of antigens (SPOA) protein [Candidatus Liberibacter africanus PTSAPSY]QTP63819.1 FliM/FliN family flagellar motor switch protein [Candidatus Liberibacter africanus]